MPFADELLGAAAVAGLAQVLAAVAPERSWTSVERSAAALDGVGLSDRARAVRDALLSDGPGDYRGFQALVRKALKDDAFTGWMIWPVTEAVATLSTGSGQAGAFEAGLELLTRLTPRLTGEFALRTWLNADLDRTLAAVQAWTRHPDEQVRRLASEGTRPRLPWSRRVPALLLEPEATIALLDQLYRDDSQYVRRSVANHLNDVSRADPALAVRTAQRWSDRPNPAAPTETARLVKHALRTLIKQGDPGALGLLGFATPAGLVVTGPHLSTSTVELGGEMTFTAGVVNPGPQSVRVAIDYVVHYQKANGALAPKVFKLTARTLAPGEGVDVVRRHAFAPLTTRRHHLGEHALELQVNGAGFGRVGFQLIAGRDGTQSS